MHTRFRQLTRLLLEYADLWRPVPFFLPVLPWQSLQPQLSSALEGLDDQAVAALEADNDALLHWLGDFLPGLALITPVVSIARSAAIHTDYPRDFERDIPGRKWQQVTAFTASIKQLDGHLVEWCSGKAHLGRALCQRFETPVTALERDAGLCLAGSALSAHHHLDVNLQQCDVLSAQAIDHARQARHMVALHACGDLHRRLLETVNILRTQSLHLSPCCYHLTADKQYRPLSQAGQESGLALSRDDLRLAVQETVTAAAAVSPRRQRKNAWRQGFDVLQRELRASDEYLPVPPMPDALLKGNFIDFCKHAAALKTLELPDSIDWARYEQAGWLRQSQVNRLDLPRHAFRRVLELWLVLDGALYLAESGYEVEIRQFCDRQLSPRNLMIAATLPGH